jgi:hypothetical protein
MKYDFYVQCLDSGKSSYLKTGKIYGGREKDLCIWSDLHKSWLVHYRNVPRIFKKIELEEFFMETDF